MTAALSGPKENESLDDNRHTLVTELAESGAGVEIIMGIAGHVSRQMLSRYSHVRNEAKRKALEEFYTRRTQPRRTHAASARHRRRRSWTPPHGRALQMSSRRANEWY